GCADCQRRLDELLADGSIASLTQAGEPPEDSPDTEYLENLRNLVAQKALSSWNVGARAVPAERRDEAGPACPASIGDYEIIEEIARGGRAVVYKARQPQLDRVVAVKRLRFRDHDSSDIKRFLREAEAVARLRHPNIVQVFQVGEDDGHPFL